MLCDFSLKKNNDHYQLSPSNIVIRTECIFVYIYFSLKITKFDEKSIDWNIIMLIKQESTYWTKYLI